MCLLTSRKSTINFSPDLAILKVTLFKYSSRQERLKTSTVMVVKENQNHAVVISLSLTEQHTRVG